MNAETPETPTLESLERRADEQEGRIAALKVYVCAVLAGATQKEVEELTEMFQASFRKAFDSSGLGITSLNPFNHGFHQELVELRETFGSFYKIRGKQN